MKGILFVFLGAGASGLIIAEAPSLQTVVLLGIAIWAFCRAYYFAFYVIEKYVDPGYRFSGLGSFLKYCLSRNRMKTPEKRDLGDKS